MAVEIVHLLWQSCLYYEFTEAHQSTTTHERETPSGASCALTILRSTLTMAPETHEKSQVKDKMIKAAYETAIMTGIFQTCAPQIDRSKRLSSSPGSTSRILTYWDLIRSKNVSVDTFTWRFSEPWYSRTLDVLSAFHGWEIIQGTIQCLLVGHGKVSSMKLRSKITVSVSYSKAELQGKTVAIGIIRVHFCTMF